MKIIGFVGLIGSGKDTAADYLVRNHNYVRDSFAGSLKDAIASIFGWDRTLLEGLTSDARAWREKIDPWWAERLNMPHLTPRWVLQYWGTEVCRLGFHDEIWIASLEKRIQSRKQNTVISDVRFPNEITAIKNLGGLIIRIKRGDDPVWFKYAVTMNAGPNHPDWISASERIRMLGIHSSETAWAGANIDLIIENNGTIAELYEKLSLVSD
jgi:hypothetical protein